GGSFGNHTGGRGVVVAPGDEGSARRTAQCRRVEAVVPHYLRRKLVHRWRRNAAAEGAELAEAGVVDQDKDDVGRALGRLYGLRELRPVGVKICPPDVAGETEVGPGQYARGVALLGVGRDGGSAKQCAAGKKRRESQHSHGSVSF